MSIDRRKRGLCLIVGKVGLWIMRMMKLQSVYVYKREIAMFMDLVWKFLTNVVMIAEVIVFLSLSYVKKYFLDFLFHRISWELAES